MNDEALSTKDKAAIDAGVQFGKTIGTAAEVAR